MTIAPGVDAAFDRFISLVYDSEGDFDDDPLDKGNWTSGVCGRGINGGTKRGISTASYPYDVAKLPAPERDAFPARVCDLTDAQIRRLYEVGYWNAVQAPAMPPALALVVADFAVNSGTGAAARALQTALGVPADGAIGPLTLHAVALRTAKIAVEALVTDVQYQRLWYLMSCDQWPHDGHGWSRRVVVLSLEAGKLLA